MIHKLFIDLPRESSDEGVLGVLAPPHEALFKLPRGMPCPKPQQDTTKWGQFAKARGIASKTHRNKLVYDKVDDDYKIRFGGRSLKKSMEKYNWIVPHKAGMPAGQDPFQVEKEKKALATAKQSMRSAENKVRKAGLRLSRPAQPKKVRKSNGKHGR